MKYQYLFILGLLVVAGLFYWFQIRPENIRKQCSYQASTETNGGYLENLKTKTENAQEPALISSSYTQCLHEKGLEK